jgi:hypothetical protein
MLHEPGDVGVVVIRIQRARILPVQALGELSPKEFVCEVEEILASTTGRVLFVVLTELVEKFPLGHLSPQSASRSRIHSPLAFEESLRSRTDDAGWESLALDSRS